MSTDHPRHADLRIPADPRMLRMARVTASALAADLAFTMQDIEDLRVAVDELSAALIDGCDPSAHLELAFELAGHELRIEGRVRDAGAPSDLHPVAADLLGLVADGYELTVDGGDRVFRFTKHGSAAPR